MESNAIIILHLLLPLVLVLLLTVAEVTSLAKRTGKGAGSIGIIPSASSEFYFDYYTLEELPVANLVGNVIIDFGLDLKYNQTVLSGLRFSFLTQTNPNVRFFTIDNQTGVIRTRSRIDREAICPGADQCTLKLDVAVQPLKFFQILQVKVEILDKNDNHPVFREKRVMQQISESAEIGSGFVLPPAVDADSARNGIRRYELVPAGSKFELQERKMADGGSELKMVLRQKLDRETVDSYHLAVYAIDGGIPPRTGSLTVDITILDANDNRPEFTRALYEVWTPENTPSGTILLTVEALDLDEGENGQVVYDLSTHSAQEFGKVIGIGPESGMIYLKEELDYESVYTYAVSVMAKDRGPDAVPSYASVVIHVEDVNDNEPMITVSTLTPSGKAEVVENADLGTFVSHLSVTDGDLGENGRVHCTVSDSKFDLLRIYRSEFKVITAGQLDRETRSVHVMTVTCIDYGDPPLTASANLTVLVLDDNDHAPRFSTNAYSVTISENNRIGDVLLSVRAVDDDSGDNARLAYHLGASASRYFRIDSASGTVLVDLVLDHETEKFIEFDVVAEDCGKPSRSTRATVRVTILDVDDESPKFVRDSYEFSVFENMPSGTAVGTVLSVDRDSPPFNLFSYDFETSRGPSRMFFLDPDTGTLSTAEVLDRERQPIYVLNVLARPMTPGSQLPTASCTVTVQVVDLNDNRPRFTFPGSGNNQLAVSDRAPVGTIVGRLEARDLDSPPNSKMVFSVASENDSSPLEVISRTGELMVRVDLTQLVADERFRMRVIVRDEGEPSLLDSAELELLLIRGADEVSYAERPDTFLASETLLVVLAVTLSVILAAILVIAVVLCTIHGSICRQRQYYERTATEEKTPIGDQCQLKIFVDRVSNNGSIGKKKETELERKKRSLFSETGCLCCPENEVRL